MNATSKWTLFPSCSCFSWCFLLELIERQLCLIDVGSREHVFRPLQAWTADEMGRQMIAVAKTLLTVLSRLSRSHASSGSSCSAMIREVSTGAPTKHGHYADTVSLFAVFSGIIGNEQFLDLMNHPSDTLMGIIVSTYNLGAFSGCIINFFIGDWLGRRRAIWVAMGFIIVSANMRAKYCVD